MMRRYPAYKDSGVEWLGEVPEHWMKTALKRVAFLQSGSTITAEAIEPEGTYPVFGGNGLRGYTEQFTHDGDYPLIGRQGALCGNVNYANGQFWASEHAIVVGQRKPFETRWMGELLRTMNLGQYSTSAAQPGIAVEMIGELPVPFPPLPEQTAIAAFLDRETAKIDALVEEQRRLIGLLREKRQAVISHAVTRGLNPDVPLKPSGIDWLGDVPEGWEVKRLRFLCKIETGTSDTQDASEDAEFPFFVRSQTVEKIGHYSHDCEAVMTSGDGAGVGKIFHHYVGKFSAHQRVYIFTDFDSVSGEFFFHYLRANFFKVALEGGAKSTVDSLRRPLIANFWMTVPPMDEQTAVLGFIKDTEHRFTLLADEAETAIALLQERRAALISAAVTGKIDVRHLAPTETEAA